MRERHKRDIVLKTDPVTNEKYWYNKVVTVHKPDEEDRLNAVLDILKGEKTAEEVRKSLISPLSTAFIPGSANMCLRRKHYLWRNKPMKIWIGRVKMTRFGNSRRNSCKPVRRPSSRSCGQRPMI